MSDVPDETHDLTDEKITEAETESENGGATAPMLKVIMIIAAKKIKNYNILDLCQV